MCAITTHHPPPTTHQSRGDLRHGRDISVPPCQPSVRPDRSRPLAYLTSSNLVRPSTQNLTSFPSSQFCPGRPPSKSRLQTSAVCHLGCCCFRPCLCISVSPVPLLRPCVTPNPAGMFTTWAVETDNGPDGRLASTANRLGHDSRVQEGHSDHLQSSPFSLLKYTFTRQQLESRRAGVDMKA